MKIFISFCILLLVNLLTGQNPVKKTMFIIADGISRDVLKQVPTPHLDAIAEEGSFLSAYVGGEVGQYSETPTISAVGYNSLLTGTWANKHNVWDNDIKEPNYHYWSLFRLLKQQNPNLTTAVYSTWLDNRTKLLGVGLPINNYLLMDDYFDGLELDTLHYPHDDESNYIRIIDQKVAETAANKIEKMGPDLTWVYLQYTDDMGHHYGDHPKFYEAVQNMDDQIGIIWQAVQQRMKKLNEEWMIVITTDHGRDAATGKDHGGQSDRERATWVVTNQSQINAYGQQQMAGVVDIFPSISYFMGLSIPKSIHMEVDGTPFLGPVEASHLQVEKQDHSLLLKWKSYGKAGKGKIWLTTNNYFKDGQQDNYFLAGEVDLTDHQVRISVKDLESSYYKVVLETDHQYLNYWIVE